MEIISAAQCRAARALLDWGQPDLADAAGVELIAIAEFEASRRPLPLLAIQAIQSAFEAVGIEFTQDSGSVCLRRRPVTEVIPIAELNASNDG